MLMLRDLARRDKRALLLSTHDLDLAVRTADRIWLMGTNGAFHVGAPEDLVLSGALRDVFRHEGLDFDAAEGAFRLHRERGQPIAVRTDDDSVLNGLWTRRALERLGFEVTPDPSPEAPRVHVRRERGAAIWALRKAGHDTAHESIETLAAALRDG
jgi:iron complex transport system ATP-binding protein